MGGWYSFFRFFMKSMDKIGRGLSEFGNGSFDFSFTVSSLSRNRTVQFSYCHLLGGVCALAISVQNVRMQLKELL